MSMWELESFAEYAIRAIDRCDLPTAQRRQLCGMVFALVQPFDVSFTHFRTARELMAAEYFHRMDAGAHPLPRARRHALDALAARGQRGWLVVNGVAEAFFTPAEDGLPDSLWFDPTMALWEQAVHAQRLTGPAAEPLAEVTSQQAIGDLVRAVATLDPPDHAVLYMLHGIAAYHCQPSWKIGDPLLAAVLQHPALHAALRAPQEDWVKQRFDARHAVAHFDEPMRSTLAWWVSAHPDE